MATIRTFQAMLNEWLNYDLLREEFVKRDYLLQKVEKDNGWKGGKLIVPFKGACASSVRFGALTGESDIAEDEYVRGEVSTQPEVWGSMFFNHRDLLEHNGKVKEQSFLKILPGAIDEFMMNMKNKVSINMLSGTHVANIASYPGGGTDGVVRVDRPERFTLGEKLQIDADAVAASDVYIIAIDMNTADITLSATRGGGAVDLSNFPVSLIDYTVAANGKLYIDGAQTNSMTSLRSSLLSDANGGSATLYGVTKTAYPYTQAIQVDGSGWSAANFIEKIFDGYTFIKNRGRGNPNTLLMSYEKLGAAMKLVEASTAFGRGSFKTTPTSTSASIYGWTEIKVVGVRGEVILVGIQEMDDDVVYYIDWRALKFHSNNFFMKRTAPDGKQFYEVRNTTGYYYIIDICLFGDIVLNHPSYCGVAHSIPSF